MIKSYFKLKEYIVENNFIGGNQLSNTKHSEFVFELINATKFLDDYFESVPLQTRCYCVYYGVFEIQFCKCCGVVSKIGKNVDHKHSHYTKFAFKKYCSRSCSSKGASELKKKNYKEKTGYDHWMNNPNVVDKIKKTNVETYGSEHFFETDNFKEMFKQHCLDVYGVEHHFKSKEVIEKRELSNIIKYGSPNAFQFSKERIKQSIINKYGVDHPLRSSEIMARLKETNISRYGVEHPLQNEDIKQKLRDDYYENFGVINPSQSHFTKEFIELINNRDMLMSEYKDLGSSHEVARKYNVGSHRTVLLQLHRHQIDVNSNIKTSSLEIRIQKFLDSHNIEYITNDRNFISPKEIDILIPKYKLAIEINGVYHHSNLFKKRDYHQEKSLDIINNGYTPFHIYSDQLENKSDIIFNKLSHFIRVNDNKVYARKCNLGLVSSKIANDFYETNHIQGKRSSSINIGLFSGDLLVACMSFSYINKESLVYDMTRYATSCNVVGGFTKLLSYFKKTYDWNELISYCLLDYSKGSVYYNNGFELICITKPNYCYIKNGRRFSRQQFMKHKLKDRLEFYDETLSEKKLMDLNGFLRLYDAGSLKFSIKKGI